MSTSSTTACSLSGLFLFSLFLTLREWSPSSLRELDKSTDLLGWSLASVEVNFWDSGENVVDVNYKPMTGPGFAIAGSISEPQGNISKKKGLLGLKKLRN